MKTTTEQNPDAVFEFDRNTILVSKTDTRGVIWYANPAFCAAANYSAAELVGQPHRMVRHPSMPRTAFSLMWEHLQAGEEFFAIVVNARAGGGCYWVLAHVVPDINPDTGDIIGFHSSRRWISPAARRAAAEVYAELLDAERAVTSKAKAVAAGRARLDAILAEAGLSYEQWVMSLALDERA